MSSRCGLCWSSAARSRLMGAESMLSAWLLDGDGSVDSCLLAGLPDLAPSLCWSDWRWSFLVTGLPWIWSVLGLLLDCPVMPSRFEGAQSFAVAPALGLSLALGFLAGCLKLLLATGWFLVVCRLLVDLSFIGILAETTRVRILHQLSHLGLCAVAAVVVG